MTGLTILKQAYSMLGDEVHLAMVDGDERGLAAVNQIYSELWSREHRTPFQPLDALHQPMLLSWRFLPAMAYGTAMLLSVGDENKSVHDRFLTLYRRAASYSGGVYGKREDTLWQRETV